MTDFMSSSITNATFSLTLSLIYRNQNTFLFNSRASSFDSFDAILIGSFSIIENFTFIETERNISTSFSSIVLNFKLDESMRNKNVHN